MTWSPDSAPVRLCAQLPGAGGAYKLSPEDFAVEEIPAYAPAGSGEHTFLWVEKRGLTTLEAARRLAAALSADPAGAGTAGLKDKQALARQWISLPRVDPARALALADTVDGLRVLDARRHPHKLRTGHLRGNRFTVTLRGCASDAAVRASAILDCLAARGLPNFYGAQRFGRDADNAARGRALLCGGGAAVRDRRERRLLASALQSALFNALLRRRVEAATQRRALFGDVLCKTATGGLFLCTDPVADQARIEAWDVQPTGPMFGPKMMAPALGSEPAILESAVLAEAGLALADFARVGRLAPGSRRPLALRLAEIALAAPAAGVLTLSFALPAGAYASVLLDEIIG